MYIATVRHSEGHIVDVNHNVTAVIINYQTPDLTKRAIGSFRSYYPQLSLLLIDNGSKDNSVEVLEHYQAQFPAGTHVLKNDLNLFHGPAMHLAMHTAKTDCVVFLDSDCEVTKGGFIEQMLSIVERDGRCYAVGNKIYMNKRGFDVFQREKAITYIRPICMLVRRTMYFTLPPFSHHGTPCLDNMRGASSAGYGLVDFPIFDYVVHKGRGTASRYGYGLGLRGKLNYVLNKLGL